LNGLAAQGAWPKTANEKLALAYRERHPQRFATYHAALLALAALGPDNPLCAMCRANPVQPVQAD
jgi:hypothetical protein